MMEKYTMCKNTAAVLERAIERLTEAVRTVDNLRNMATIQADVDDRPTTTANAIDVFRAMAAAVPTPAKTDPLSRHQFKFTAMVAALIAFAYERGYRLTFGSARSAPGNTPKHSANSLHYDALAVDLNLFQNIGGKWEYMTKTEDHRELGEFWESIGGAWGGRFNDGNHYSLAYQGRK